jgi:hypothetical protein
MNVRLSKSKAGSLGSAFFCLFPSVIINSKINFSLQDSRCNSQKEKINIRVSTGGNRLRSAFGWFVNKTSTYLQYFLKN